MESFDVDPDIDQGNVNKGSPDVDLIAILANQVVNETNRRKQGGGAKRRINAKKKTSEN